MWWPDWFLGLIHSIIYPHSWYIFTSFLLNFHVQLKVLVVTDKALNGLRPQHTLECVSQKTAPQSKLLKVATRKEAKKAMRNQAFFVGILKLWNRLPTEVHQTPSPLAFNKLIKTEQYRDAFSNLSKDAVNTTSFPSFLVLSFLF